MWGTSEGTANHMKSSKPRNATKLFLLTAKDAIIAFSTEPDGPECRKVTVAERDPASSERFTNSGENSAAKGISRRNPICLSGELIRVETRPIHAQPLDGNRLKAGHLIPNEG